MKTLIGLVIISMMISCKGKQGLTDEFKLDNDTDSISYYTGIFTAWTIREMDLNQINNEAFHAGIREGLNNEKPKVSKADANVNIKWFFDTQAKKQAEKYLAEGRAYLEQNKTRKEIITTSSGLQYEIMRSGTGIKPHEDDSLLVHFKGTLIDGTEFANTIQTGPETFSLKQQDEMRGWLEALQLMDIGSKYKFYLPAELGFGNNQPPISGIKPNAVLIFDMELISGIPNKSISKK